MEAQAQLGRLVEQAVDEMVGRMRGAFGRVETRRKARSFIKLLLEPVARKNGWQLAERAA
jgi:hypothetical protein